MAGVKGSFEVEGRPAAGEYYSGESFSGHLGFGGSPGASGVSSHSKEDDRSVVVAR